MAGFIVAKPQSIEIRDEREEKDLRPPPTFFDDSDMRVQMWKEMLGEDHPDVIEWQRKHDEHFAEK